MYKEKMIEIGKVDNGYVIEAKMPMKQDKKKETKDMMVSYEHTCEREYVAKSKEEAAAIVSKLMPLLDEEYGTEEAFDAAFNEAAKTKM